MASALIAYCGLYCGACSFQVAYETKDKKHLQSMPSVYDKYKNDELENCPGCRLENKCGECKIRDCAIRNKVEYCNQCKQYPCDKINAFGHDNKPHHNEIFENFKMLNDLGEEKWLDMMKKKSTCSICNARYSWYYKKCNCNNSAK